MVLESGYHLDSARAVEHVHSFPPPQQHDVFAYNQGPSFAVQIFTAENPKSTQPKVSPLMFECPGRKLTSVLFTMAGAEIVGFMQLRAYRWF